MIKYEKKNKLKLFKRSLKVLKWVEVFQKQTDCCVKERKEKHNMTEQNEDSVVIICVTFEDK